jgi:hypothetical protein
MYSPLPSEKKRPSLGPWPKKRDSGGFVLVAVLLLIALATVLIVTTSGVSQIERKAVSNSAKEQIAKQNALFALQIALGQLQSAAGPDQRVTARAEILNTPTVNEPYWTGVWKTGTNYLDVGLSAQRSSSLGALTPTASQISTAAAWLVSGATNNATINPISWTNLGTTNVAAYGNSTNSVIMAQNYGTNLSSQTVLAPLVLMKNGTTNLGAYAYWVSDEGVKAKVNLVDPTYGVTNGSGTNFVQNQLHFLMPQAVAVFNTNDTTTSPGLLGSNNLVDIRGNTNLSKVTTLQSVSFIPGISNLSGTNASLYSPDTTTYSYGVISDVCNGGLKQDLSLAFEDTAQYAAFQSAHTNANDANGDAKLYEILPNLSTTLGSNTNANTAFIVGVRWQSLFNYYSLYKSTIPYPTGCTYKGLYNYSTDPGTATPKIDQRYYSYNSIPYPGSNAAAIAGEAYMPQFMGMSYDFYLSSKQNTSNTNGTNNYSLLLWASPKAVYYNPFNLTINAVSKTNGILRNNMLGGVLWNVSVGASNVVNGTPLTWIGGVTISTNTTTNASGQMVNTITTNGTIPNVNLYYTNTSFTPGELKCFGISSSSQVINGYENVNDGSSNTMLLSSYGAGAQYGYVLASNATTPTNIWSGSVADASSVTVTLLGNMGGQAGQIFANTASRVFGTQSYWPTNSAQTTYGNFGGNVFFNNTNTTFGQIGKIIGTTFASANGHPVASYIVRAKGLNSLSSSKAGIFNVPIFSGADGYLSPFYYQNDNTEQDVLIVAGTALGTSSNEIGGITDSTWGSNDLGASSTDPSAVILYDIPRQPMLSLGQFMHAQLRTGMGTSPRNAPNVSMYPFGGSIADPFVPLTNSYISINQLQQSGKGFGSGYELFFNDDNFNGNAALFDTYYFSSLPPFSPDTYYKNIFPTLTATSGSGAFTSNNVATNGVVLPNSRMKFYFKNGTAPALTSTTTPNSLQNYNTSAAHLMMEGAFNVNSTSIAAWASLLSSLSGNSVNCIGYGSLSAAQLKNPIFRFTSLVSNNGTSPINRQWGGVVALRNDQIYTLAQKIVDQVRARGPFLNMADFLNRRLSTAKVTSPSGVNVTLGTSGALQAAIDNSGINNPSWGVGSTTNVSGYVNTMPTNFTALPTNTAIGIPGWLMQQDLVQCFSSVMTVRSDTFMIRVYGEERNPKTGVIESQAWGEAVVQRTPEFLDQSDPVVSNVTGAGDATPLASVDSTNQQFGRRFKIVSFRWINQNEL